MRKSQGIRLGSTSNPTIPIDANAGRERAGNGIGSSKSTLLIELDRSADFTNNYSPSDALLGQIRVRGINLDSQTRCAHYHGPTDIIAFKLKCCRQYYACKDCHAE